MTTNLHYVVCAAGGASGHFLGHFLHPQYKSHTAEIRIDLPGKQNNPIDDGHTHNMSYTSSEKKVIRILTPSRSEKIKAVFNNFYKNNLDCVFDLPNVIDNYYDLLLLIKDKEYNHKHIEGTYGVCYKDIFNLLYLAELYYNINNTICPDYKISYAHSYVSKHIKLYNSFEYKVLEKIFNFEYDNNLIESVSGKMRSWSTDHITVDNWQQFLMENLCLKNYS